MRLLFLLVVLAALAAPAWAAPILNVAIFLADDVGYGDLRLNGGPIATPNLERIAREGTHFRQFHVTAVCSSTRAALLTGVYQQRMTTSGALDTALKYDSTEGIPSWTVTIPEMLSTTHGGRVMLGKWHLGGNLGRQPQFHPMRHGITYFEGILGPQGDMNFPPWYRNLSRVTGFHNYVTTYTADRAIAQINYNTNLGRPWFLYMPFQAAHAPFALPRDPKGTNNRTKRPEVIRILDQSVGRVMDRIRTLERPTLVFYTHDNGSPLASDNRPFRGAKKQLWQGGIQEPLLAWGPGIVPAGRTVDAVADVKDILPTVADVTDLPVPAGVDGRSLVPLWQGRELPDRTLFWNTPERWFAAREGNWKFHLHPDGRTELYNLATDRHEDRNLALAMPGKVAGMRAALAAWRADVGR